VLQVVRRDVSCGVRLRNSRAYYASVLRLRKGVTWKGGRRKVFITANIPVKEMSRQLEKVGWGWKRIVGLFS
jgi:hypothetical protein